MIKLLIVPAEGLGQPVMGCATWDDFARGFSSMLIEVSKLKSMGYNPLKLQREHNGALWVILEKNAPNP